MQITRLSAAECEDLYRSALPRDFPAAELKPFAEIQRLLESGVYEPLLLTDDAGARLAYAWQRPADNCRMRTNEYPTFCPVCQRAICRVIEFYTE